MIKIFKQLWRHWAACIAVVALLFVQAYCDLACPTTPARSWTSASSRAALKALYPRLSATRPCRHWSCLCRAGRRAGRTVVQCSPMPTVCVPSLTMPPLPCRNWKTRLPRLTLCVHGSRQKRRHRRRHGRCSNPPPSTTSMPLRPSLLRCLRPPAHRKCCSQLAAAFASLDDSVAGGLSSHRPCCWSRWNMRHRASPTMSRWAICCAPAADAGPDAAYGRCGNRCRLHRLPRVGCHRPRPAARCVPHRCRLFQRRDREVFHCIAHHPHDQRHSAGAVRLRYPAAHDGLCADPRHRRHPACGRRQHGADMDHLLSRWRRCCCSSLC